MRGPPLLLGGAFLMLGFPTGLLSLAAQLALEKISLNACMARRTSGERLSGVRADQLTNARGACTYLPPKPPATVLVHSHNKRTSTSDGALCARVLQHHQREVLRGGPSV